MSIYMAYTSSHTLKTRFLMSYDNRKNIRSEATQRIYMESGKEGVGETQWLPTSVLEEANEVRASNLYGGAKRQHLGNSGITPKAVLAGSTQSYSEHRQASAYI